MELKTFFAQDGKGDLIAAATVYVYFPGTTNTATIFDENGDPLANPFNSDAQGAIKFQAANGYYDVRVITGSNEYTLKTQLLDQESITTSTGDESIVGALDSRVNKGAVGSENVTTATGAQAVAAALDQRGPVFDSVADMDSAADLYVGVKVRTLGYYTPGDGGGNDYEIVAAGTGTDDKGAYIDLPGSGLQAKGLFVDGRVSVLQFGAQGDLDPSTGAGTDDADAFVNALAFSEVVTGPARAYRLSKSLDITGKALLFDRPRTWLPGFAFTFTEGMESGAVLVFTGTGAKTETLDGVSSSDTTGGVITNPASAEPYTTNAPSPEYRLLDFTNADASGATPATLKGFSCAVKMGAGSGSRLSNCAILPSYNGVSGYQDESNTGLGDEWDVGLWSDNHQSEHVENVQVLGYWRMAAHLKTQATGGSVVSSQNGRYDRCTFQGYRGVALRSHDVYRVTAVTSSSVEIPWSASHTFDSTGTVRASGKDMAYTGLSFSGDKLTFTGISDTSGVSAGASLRKSGGAAFGFDGTQYTDCFITGLYHSSRLPSTHTALDAPFSTHSIALEMGGEPLRGVQFTLGSIFSRDDVLYFLHNVGDPIFFGTYFEGQYVRDAVDGPVDAYPAGGRLIAVAASSGASPYPAANTRSLNHRGCTYRFVDAGPWWPDTSLRFGSTTGLFDPREISDDSRVLEEDQSGWTRLVHRVGGKTLFGPDSGDTVLQGRGSELHLQSALRVRFKDTTGTEWGQFSSSGVIFEQANPVVQANTGRLELKSEAGNVVALKEGSTTMLQANPFYSAWEAGADNTWNLGRSAVRYKEIFCANATINTSDQRAKTDTAPIDDAVLDAWADVEYQQFRWTHAVEDKGVGARLHFGLIAQRVRDVFAAHGLDPFTYGLLCHDEWGDEFETWEAEYRQVLNDDNLPMTDERGEPVLELVCDAGSRRIVQGGDRYGLRYEQCLVLEAALMRRTTQRLEDRLDTLASGM